LRFTDPRDSCLAPYSRRRFPKPVNTKKSQRKPGRPFTACAGFTTCTTCRTSRSPYASLPEEVDAIGRLGRRVSHHRWPCSSQPMNDGFSRNSRYMSAFHATTAWPESLRRHRLSALHVAPARHHGGCGSRDQTVHRPR
jgi:hypothetical protein